MGDQTVEMIVRIYLALVSVIGIPMVLAVLFGVSGAVTGILIAPLLLVLCITYEYKGV